MKPMAAAVYQGSLYRYGTDGIFGVKKIWKQCFVVLTEDSTFSAYKNDSRKTKLYETKISENTLWLAFGKDAEKYDPPRIAETNIPVEYNYLIAIPKNKDREMVAWFAAGSQQEFKELIHAMALTVKSTSKPPVLGGKRYENKNIAERIRHIFNLGSKAEDWEIYWLAGSVGESGSDYSKPPTPMSTPLPYRVQLPPSTPVSQRSQESTPLPERSAPLPTPPVKRSTPPTPPAKPTVPPASPVGRSAPPTPPIRKSVLPVKPLQFMESNLKDDNNHKNGKTVHSATIVVVGKGVERVPSKLQTSNEIEPRKLCYDLCSPNEFTEIVSEESNWRNGYITGKTIRTVECTTRKLSKEF